MLWKAQKWAPQGCPTDKATEGMTFIQPELSIPHHAGSSRKDGLYRSEFCKCHLLALVHLKDPTVGPGVS